MVNTFSKASHVCWHALYVILWCRNCVGHVIICMVYIGVMYECCMLCHIGVYDAHTSQSISKTTVIYLSLNAVWMIWSVCSLVSTWRLWYMSILDVYILMVGECMYVGCFCVMWYVNTKDWHLQWWIHLIWRRMCVAMHCLWFHGVENVLDMW